MGVGMQIVYLGFTGSAALEAEAGAELVRLDRFCGLISGCHLAIEALHPGTGRHAYGVRLDLVMRNGVVKPVDLCVAEDAREAVHRAFADAERMLTAWQDGPLATGRALRQATHVHH
ncbi:metal ABC transporter ATPase [Burkholderia guangdongensis]|uniref:metal ABC transporter ATPase n=1 Tax=Burkholderia guangdongensis TaxID=1792500 RepID=UPI0015CDE97E|nr:metal ABC transporter ATPase [Burkholderia guangdongensis]